VLTPASLNRRGWTNARLGAALALVGASVAVAFDAWRDIFRIATRDDEASHVFLVPFVVAWLFWTRRGRLRHIRPAESFAGPLGVLLGWALYSVGDTLLLQSLYHAGAIVMAVGCLVTVLGPAMLKQFLPAFLTLVLLIPLPGRLREQIAIPLQTWTARLTAELFSLLGAPVTRSGNMLSVNGSDIEIAEACNGLRMTFVLGLAVIAFAFGSPMRTYARVLLLVATPFAAVACNVVRLVPTVWLYGYHPASFATTFHDVGGWVTLGVAYLLLLGIIRLLRWALLPVTTYTLAYD
jgi:exosortase